MNSPSGPRCPTEDPEAGQLARNSRTRTSLKGKQLTRSHAITESTSPPRCFDSSSASSKLQATTSKSLDIISDSDTNKQSSLLYSSSKRDNDIKPNSTRFNCDSDVEKRNAGGDDNSVRRTGNTYSKSNANSEEQVHCYVVSDIIRDSPKRPPDPGQMPNQLTVAGPPTTRLEVVSPKHRKDELQLNDPVGIDLLPFLADTLNKNQKDRFTMLRIEKELVSLVKDKQRHVHKFPPMSSYNRMLVHRCAAFFGMEHNIDPTQQCVIVSKTAVTKLPPIHFKEYIKDTSFEEPRNVQSRSILKRDAHSFDEARTHLRCPDRYYGMDNRRSKSFEEREEAYEKARQRIFKDRQSGENSTEELKFAWSSTESGEVMILNSSMDNSLHLQKVYSLDGSSGVYRPIVSKSFSFGGYSGPSRMSRNDSLNSTKSAGARLISKQDSCTSGTTPWRLSPSSSGYKTQSHSLHSDSITPSPTGYCSITPEPPQSPAPAPVVWAVTDIANVPRGSLLIDPQTGHPIRNKDGSVYTFDPENLPPTSISDTQYDLSSSNTSQKSGRHYLLKKRTIEENIHRIQEDNFSVYDNTKDFNSTEFSLDETSNRTHSPSLSENSKTSQDLTERFTPSLVIGGKGPVEELSNQMSALNVNKFGSKMNSPNEESYTPVSTHTPDKTAVALPSTSLTSHVQYATNEESKQPKVMGNSSRTRQGYQSNPVNQNNPASVHSYIGEDGCYYQYSDPQVYGYSHLVPPMPYGQGQTPYTSTMVFPDSSAYPYAYGANSRTPLLCSPANMQQVVYPTYGSPQGMVYHTPADNIYGYMPQQAVFYAPFPAQNLMPMNAMNNQYANVKPSLVPPATYSCPEPIPPEILPVNPTQMNQFQMNQVQLNKASGDGYHVPELPIVYHMNPAEPMPGSSQPGVPPAYNHLYMNYATDPNYMYQNNRIPSQMMYMEPSPAPYQFTRQSSVASSNESFPNAQKNFSAPLVRPAMPRNNKVPSGLTHYDANLNRVFVNRMTTPEYVPMNNPVPYGYNSNSVNSMTTSPRDPNMENAGGRMPLMELNPTRITMATANPCHNAPRMTQQYYIPSGQVHPYINAPNLTTRFTDDSNTANEMNRTSDSFISGNISYITSQMQQLSANYQQNIRMKSTIGDYRKYDDRRH